MPLPVRLRPTRSVAAVYRVAPTGSPEMDAPLTPALSPPRGEGEEGTAPLSRPFGPVPLAGEPARRLKKSHMTWAAAQEVKLLVTENGGICLRSGSELTLFPPGPAHG